MCARAVVYLLALGVRGAAGSKLAGPVLQDCGKVGDEVRAAPCVRLLGVVILCGRWCVRVVVMGLEGRQLTWLLDSMMVQHALMSCT